MKKKTYSLVFMVLMGSVCAEPNSLALTNTEESKASKSKEFTKLPATKEIAFPKSIRWKNQIPADFKDCGATVKARELARLISSDVEQLRPIIQCNAKLSRIAAQKAKEMAEEGEVSHQGRKYGPNERLYKSGYRLTANEKAQYNSVEAILGGEEFAEETLFKFKMSYGHKIHLLGEHNFYLSQTQLGVGYYNKWHSPHIDYWVVYFAEEEVTDMVSEPSNFPIIKGEK